MSRTYHCDNCGASGCKLWREYQTFANHTKLLCAPCAGRDQGKDVSDIDRDGAYPSELAPGDRTDQIGWFVPAIPVEGEDCSAFWGYTSVICERVDWWRALPSVPEREAQAGSAKAGGGR